MLPLTGTRVIDLTVVLSGTAATMLLGDLGADVIRVESRRHYPSATKGPRRPVREAIPGLGNSRRGYADRDPGHEPWHRFAVANINGRNKRSVTLELETPSGRKAFEALVRAADILAENNAPGFLERRGLSPHILFELNPKLVLVRMPGVAEEGPLTSIRGLGPAFEAMAGIRDLRGYPDLPREQQPESMYMDATTGPAAVAAIIAALQKREATGTGSYVVISQLGVMMDHAADQYLAAQSMPPPTPPRENFSWTMAPHQVYRCHGPDEWLAITCRNDTEWGALHDLVVAELPDSPLERAASLAIRLERWLELDEWVQQWTALRGKYQAFRELQQAHITAAPVLREGELLSEPHMIERGFFLDLDHPAVGVRRTPGLPWRSSRWTSKPDRASPLLGEHNASVLRELLGYEEEEYQKLVSDGEIGTTYY